MCREESVSHHHQEEKEGGHAGHHGGAWKVAYADFVTAMMAFFLVMWLVAQSNAVKAAVSGYFKDPGIFDHAKSNGPIPGGETPLEPDAPARIRTSDSKVVVGVGDAKALEKMAGQIRQMLEDTPEFTDLKKQVEIQMTPDGLRIELVEGEESTFFDSGSSHVRQGTERLLLSIAQQLGALQNQIILEGHTDAQPFSRSGIYTNWELSADRANSARRIMEEGGLRARQVVGVRGFADTHLRVADNPSDARNRRVTIIVMSYDPRVVAALSDSPALRCDPRHRGRRVSATGRRKAAPGRPDRRSQHALAPRRARRRCASCSWTGMPIVPKGPRRARPLASLPHTAHRRERRP